jgi:hypothetical protein
VQIVNAKSGQVMRRLADKLLVEHVAFSPSGSQLAGGGRDNAVHLWEVATGQERWVARNASAISSVAFAPDGRMVATGDYDGYVKLWSGATGESMRSLDGKGGIARAVAFSPEGRLLAMVGDSNDVLLLETATWTPVLRLAGHHSPVWTCAFTPDGLNLVTGSFDATGLVWDLSGRAFANKRTGPWNEAALERLWADLGSTNAALGYQAVWSLLYSGQRGISFLETRLYPIAAAAKVIARLIAELDDDVFATREAASAALGRMGLSAEGDLRAALAKKPSAEARQRLEQLLRKLPSAGHPGLRGLRLVAGLELADLPEARGLLTRLADRDPALDVRRHARAALERLRKRTENTGTGRDG